MSLIVVVSGVAGSGKTTIGRMLADRWGVTYAEADDFHTETARRKMEAGQPLSEEDRQPWLEAIAAWIDTQIAAGESGVVTCSALKKAYRAKLKRPQAREVFLKADPATIEQRLRQRKGHFFPKELAASQFAALEEPTPEEGVVVVDAHQSPPEIVSQIFKTLGIP